MTPLADLFDLLREAAPVMAKGAGYTLAFALASMVGGLVLGFPAAVLRIAPWAPLRWPAALYVSAFRGTPLLLQVYLIYLGLPTLGRQFALDAVPSGIIALSLCYGAYMAEIFRAGILGVPHGQRDAAMALGLPPGLTFRKIIFPQAMRLIVPPTGNQFIAMLKDSSLVSVMGVWELTKTAQIIGKRATRVPATDAMMWTPSTRSVLASARILTKPSVARLARARALAVNGNLPTL